MKCPISFLFALLLVCVWQSVATAAEAPSVRILFDTDMDSDCDDAGALAILHALADAGEVELLGALVSSSHPWSGACVDAINTYFGRPDLPIGVSKAKSASRQGSKFAKRISEEFSHDFPEGNDAPDAVTVYRQVLAAQPDKSVVIVTVGDLTNLRYLLESTADDVSPLGGRELVAAKVKEWVCMGSRYPADLDPNPWGNFKMDPESTEKAIANWPTTITFTGGGAFADSVATGKTLSELPKDNPVRRVYELYFGGAARNRHSADQIAVMVAARGSGAPWKLVTQGRNKIFANGTHQWEETPNDPRHQYVSALLDETTAKEVAAEMETLMRHLPKEQTTSPQR
ncbi:nucleoside hydrolase [Blastopirellula sp. JC732]|uniref:Nucleoside hydrolase n=1 Tax=Blastopirellula sediminis TaxID=2894196 RepID=A0A9X1MMV0_9BACT|nr:nucleoside hydrolase [Blastopirellula sediminis]MCC9607148.1 nucleoside hydrolase [Blastopirellula sediminis]MCC9629559.1 nucleoside hydrolase [Blastopirellula sediminis]